MFGMCPYEFIITFYNPDVGLRQYICIVMPVLLPVQWNI